MREEGAYIRKLVDSAVNSGSAICKSALTSDFDFCIIISESPYRYRLENGEPYDPQGWVWNAISYNPPTEFDTREIQSYLDENGKLGPVTYTNIFEYTKEYGIYQ